MVKFTGCWLLTTTLCNRCFIFWNSKNWTDKLYCVNPTLLVRYENLLSVTMSTVVQNEFERDEKVRQAVVVFFSGWSGNVVGSE